MFLADVASRRFGLTDTEHTLVVAAALLHDIGHGPFSHASEPLMNIFLNRSHDDIEMIVEELAGKSAPARGDRSRRTLRCGEREAFPVRDNSW